MRALVLFDFDGTLADSLTVALDVYNGVAPSLGTPPLSADDTALRRMNPREALKATGIPMWKLPKLVTAVRSGMRSRMDEIRMFPGVRDALAELVADDFRVGIVSSNARENIEACLTRHEVVNVPVLGAGTSLFGKASVLRKVLRSENVPPSQAIYVGDEVRDIAAAREVGMRCVAVSWGYAARSALVEQQPEGLVDGADALVERLRALSA